MIIAVSALIGFAIGLVAGYALATSRTTNQKIGVLSDKRDCGVETEEISQSVKVLALLEVSYQETSSSTNYSSSTVRVTGDTFVTLHGSVYHSRRNCGKLKAVRSVRKFLSCMECGCDQLPTFYEDRLPQPVKRK